LDPSRFPHPGLTFRWIRTITRRSWYIHNDGTQWIVTQRSNRGVPNPADDSGGPAYDTTTLSSSNKLYSFDDSALDLSHDEISASVGDFVYEEKQFNYEVDVRIGGVWFKVASQAEGQILNAERTGSTGTVASDWAGVENSFSARTIPVQITEGDVRAIVGGTEPISIDAHAND